MSETFAKLLRIYISDDLISFLLTEIPLLHEPRILDLRTGPFFRESHAMSLSYTQSRTEKDDYDAITKTQTRTSSPQESDEKYDHLAQQNRTLDRLEDHDAPFNQNGDEAARATDEVMRDQERARHFKAGIRKLDWAIVPPLLLMWLANFVDRSNAVCIIGST